MSKINEEIRKMQLIYGLRKNVKFNSDEQDQYSTMRKNNEKLPDEVLFNSDWGFYKTVEADAGISKDDISQLIQYQQLRALEKIKGCLVFFVVLTVILLVSGLVYYLRLIG